MALVLLKNSDKGTLTSLTKTIILFMLASVCPTLLEVLGVGLPVQGFPKDIITILKRNQVDAQSVTG